MKLSPDFRFSQNNLQDFLDCPRRFELRYILRQKWPAIQSEPVIEQELLMEEGRLFHQMVQQYVTGLGSDSILDNASSPDLIRWWSNLIQYDPFNNLPSQRFAEQSLSAPLAEFRLTAQYDLLAIAPGKQAVIIDWKTSAKKPSHNVLNNRLQTRVYRYLLVAAGEHLNNNAPVDPGQVEMVYWFTEFPAEPERFSYDRDQFDADREYLSKLIGDIARLNPGQFYLTPDEGKCRYCVYRSLCDRGEKAGDWKDQESEAVPASMDDAGLGFEQIGEIEF